MTVYDPGRTRRTHALRVLRSRFLYWCLFFLPAAATGFAWEHGYFGVAGPTGLAAVIGGLWFVRVWHETETR